MPEIPGKIEDKDCDIDLRHHLLHQRTGFDVAVLPLAQRFRERVRLQNQLPERVLMAAAASFHRIVLFADRGEHVGECLQGPQDEILAD